MYASEIAPPNVRGPVGGLYAINASFAYVLTECMGNIVKVWGILAVVSMFIFLVGYAVIINAFSYADIAGILPMATRSTVVASTVGFVNCLVIMLVQVTPIAIETISWKYFMIFVIGDAIFLVFFYFP